MKQFWKDSFDTVNDEDVISQLARRLFTSRKRVESAENVQLGHDGVGHHSNAFASQEETWRAIRGVLELRHKYLESKGIAGRVYVLTGEELSLIHI